MQMSKMKIDSPLVPLDLVEEWEEQQMNKTGYGVDTHPRGNYHPRDVPYQGDAGLKTLFPLYALPYDYFRLYFTAAVVNKIVQETN